MNNPGSSINFVILFTQLAPFSAIILNGEQTDSKIKVCAKSIKYEDITVKQAKTNLIQ